MRPIRENKPGRSWMLTSRCLESRFFLKPDPEAVQIMGFILARALRLFPGIELAAFTILSNHLHFVVTDRAGQLSDFCQYFFGKLSFEINILRGRTGTVFPRRFSAEEIVEGDSEAFARVVRYVLMNPVEARLVSTYCDWPGLIGWDRLNRRMEFQRFNRRAYRLALRRAVKGSEPRPEDFIDTEILEVSPLPEGVDADEIEREIIKDTARLNAKKPHVLGCKAILAQRFDAQPSKTKTSCRPVCHASSREAWEACLAATRRFRAKYAAASDAFRAGAMAIIFPDWSFRPSTYVRGEIVAT